MKKLISLFVFALMLSGCNCIMSQSVPSQYLSIDETCGAAMPDYRPLLFFSDNCGIDTIEQTPPPGSWLTMDNNPVTTALIRAIDKAKNYTDVMFTVTLLDDKPPVLDSIDNSLIAEVYDRINTMYDNADRMLAYQELWFDSNFDYEAVGIPDTLIQFQEYFNKVHLMWSTPALGFTGEGGRWHTFISTSDTLLIRPKDDAWIGLMK